MLIGIAPKRYLIPMQDNPLVASKSYGNVVYYYGKASSYRRVFFLRITRLFHGIVIFMVLTLVPGGVPAPTGRGVLFGGA